MLTKRVDIDPFTYLSDNRKFGRFERILGGVVKGWRLVGIPIDPSNIRTPIIRYCAIGFGLFMFIFNLIANFTILISGVQSFESTTKRWNRLINEANFAITLMAIYAGILFRTASSWKGLIHVLRQMEQLQIFEAQDYNSFQKIIFKGKL